jgi:chromosome segregation ATPase
MESHTTFGRAEGEIMSYANDFEKLTGKKQEPAAAKPKQEPAIEEQVETAAEEVANLQAEANEEPVDLEVLKQRSLESLEDEVKKLREEAKKRRLENNALKEQAAQIFEEDKKKMESEIKKRDDQIKKLEKLMDDLAKKTESKTEEVSNAAESASSKTELVELQAKEKELENIKKKFDEAQSRLKEIEDQKKEEQEIRRKAYQNKIDEILDAIPEQKRKFADALVKGFTDIQEGYFALLEAKQEKLFDNKVIEVSHAVPKGDDETREEIKGLNSKGKIKLGLKNASSGGIKPGDRLV